MNHLIDLDRYPLNQEGSPAWHHRSTLTAPSTRLNITHVQMHERNKILAGAEFTTIYLLQVSIGGGKFDHEPTFTLMFDPLLQPKIDSQSKSKSPVTLCSNGQTWPPNTYIPKGGG